MNLFEILRDVQDARARIAQWGLSFGTLGLLASGVLVVFLFSLRELLAWYFKINQLRRELREIKTELQKLRDRA